jgi:hypothetical protein
MLISHTAPWSRNISLELPDIPVLPHNLIPPRLRRHLLKWRAEVKSALYSRRALIALLARRVGRSEDLDQVVIPLILDIALEVVWIEEQLLDYLEQVQTRHRRT